MSTNIEYNKNNVFAKIIAGEIPCEKVYENENVLAFEDIHPKAAIHVILIPKNQYVNMNDFAEKASEQEKDEILKAIPEIAKIKNTYDYGYKVKVNCGENAGQEIPHFHFHIMSDKEE
jgi:diadenosine tetraphosphate (Ap4A) HIT family hydrolase